MGRKKLAFTPPKSFLLSNYNDLKNMNIEQWYAQINRRLDITLSYKSEDKRKKRIEEILADPLGEFEKFQFRKRRFALDGYGIQVASFKDYLRLRRLRKGIKPMTPSELSSAPLILNQKNETLSDKQKEEIYDGLVMVTLDLNLPDSCLKNGFKNILAKLRRKKEFVKVKPINRKDLENEKKNWFAQKLLPYWDLDYWRQMNKKTIPYRIYAELLFPTKTKPSLTYDSEDIRKTVKPNSNILFSEEKLWFIHTTLRSEL